MFVNISIKVVILPNTREVLGNIGVLSQTRGFAVHDTLQVLQLQPRGSSTPFLMYVGVSNQEES
jgi:hypothetical protein